MFEYKNEHCRIRIGWLKTKTTMMVYGLLVQRLFSDKKISLTKQIALLSN